MTVVSPCTQGLMDSAHPQALLSRLNEQRSQGLYCDVTIVVEDVKFWAHRNILAACSGYFRSAFTTPEVWSCSQVLELMDLKSEVFASILNFIYCSKVASLSIEDSRGLLAAGKRLGIPFLEKLMEQERQGSGFPQVQTIVNPVITTGPSEAPGSHQTKKENPRPEEPDSARGPRITNAFSITEVGPGNNPFTPTDLRSGTRQLPDLGHPLAGCPPLCTLTEGNEPRQTLSEHSYAVSQGHKPTENRGGIQGDNKKATKPTQSQQRQLANRNTGPLKKRHRLRGILDKSTHPTLTVAHTPLHTTESSTTLINGTPVTYVVMSPPALYSQAEAETSTAKELPLAIDKGHKDLDPPTLSPHTEDNISFYGCEYCPEIFSNKAHLTSHTEIHKKRFVSHLFCKFCRRKFMHLKRLRNHEQVCPKALRGSSDQQPNDKEATDSMPTMDNTITDVQLPPPELPDPFIPNTLQMNTSKTQQPVDRVVRPGGGQRAYNCSVCKRAYVTLSSLKRHENVHSWQRAYPCHYCNKVFALAEYRTKHEIWHTGERRYQCIFCLETFMTYYILKNHQKSFHGIDPRLAVNKKSVSGGFKGSVYPIKLYRLLPMTFRKRRRYKTYSQTYSEGLEGSDQAPLGCNSPIPPFEDSDAINNPDAGCGTQPLFSMPVTFMATPKVVASVMPRISFDQPCDQDVDQYMGIEVEGCLQGGSKFSSTCIGKQAAPSHSELNGPPLISYNYTTPLVTMQPGGEASALDYGDGAGAASQAFKSSGRSSPKMPFLELNPLSTMNRLGELSAAAHRLEAMTDQLFQPGAESVALSRAVRGKTETYIAKPACPGPSMDSHVLPLCQITVKIGNEAIIRRRIKGSKLFPRKRKRSQCSKIDDTGRDRPTEGSVESPSLRLRTEVTSVIEPDPCDDLTDRDTADKLWHPYYSYKPKKKKSKKLRSKHKKKRLLSYSMTSAAPKSNEDYLDTSCRSADESISSESMEIKHRLRNSIPKTIYTCDICASPFITVSGLRAHIIGSHPNFCRTCGKQCPSGEPPSCDTNRGGRDFICKNCMENGSCFDNTARSHSTEKRYRCSFCPQRFLYLATKRSHEKKHQETTSNGYNCDYYPIPLNNSATLDVNLKKHAIKKEEGEDQEDIESKESLESTGNFSNEKMEPKIEQWEGTGDYMSVSPKMEDPVRINSDGHYQKITRTENTNVTPMSLPCTDTIFCRSPVQHRKPQKSSKTTLQHQTSLTSKRQKKDCMDREVPIYKGPLTMPRTGSYDNYGQSSPMCQKVESVTRRTPPIWHRAERHMCKEEPSFQTTDYSEGHTCK